VTAALMLLVAWQAAAVKPSGHSGLFVNVDFVVLNYARSYTEERDAWGRPHRTPTLTIWVSYWDCLTVPLGWTGASVPVALIARGWDAESGVRSIVPCSEGWLIASEKANVIASDLSVVCSPYDWELRNRWLYWPIRP
jgi:hypothetical protein